MSFMIKVDLVRQAAMLAAGGRGPSHISDAGGTSAADGGGCVGSAGICSSAGVPPVAVGGQLEQLQVMYLYLQAAVVGGQLSEVLAAVDASSSPA
jgi:hypothetical protein